MTSIGIGRLDEYPMEQTKQQRNTEKLFNDKNTQYYPITHLSSGIARMFEQIREGAGYASGSH